MKSSRLTMAVALAVTSLVACSSTDFPYRRFFPDFKNFANPEILESLNLMGTAADGSDDFPFSGCVRYKGDGSVSGTNCVVVSVQTWEQIRKDYADAMRRLKKCGSACK